MREREHFEGCVTSQPSYILSSSFPAASPPPLNKVEEEGPNAGGGHSYERGYEANCFLVPILAWIFLGLRIGSA